MAYYYNSSKTLLPLLFLSILSISPVAKSASFNITIGSSVTTSDEHSYWLSPSGTFSFGFYPINKSDDVVHHIVGIWITNSSCKTLVWVANRDDLPTSGPSSILFNHYGAFVQVIGEKVKPLLSNAPQESASYAMILDNGNLVLYNANSQIIWESFDHPTDTILPGQTLTSGSKLVASSSTSHYSSGGYELVMENTCDINIYYGGVERGYVSHIYSLKDRSKHIMMNLYTNGNLYLVDWDGLVLKSLFKNKERINGSLALYWATLDPDGIFRLYMEQFGFDKNAKSWDLSAFYWVQQWKQFEKSQSKEKQFEKIFDIICLTIYGLFAIGCVVLAIKKYKDQRVRAESALSSTIQMTSSTNPGPVSQTTTTQLHEEI